MKMNKKWRINDTYSIIENNKRLIGKVIKIDNKGYHVQWNDGQITIEDNPDQMINKINNLQILNNP
jgi:hypothetical protein